MIINISIVQIKDLSDEDRLLTKLKLSYERKSKKFRLSEKMLRIKQRFSIKKFSIGVLSVGLAAVCYLSPSVQAGDENSQTEPKVAESAVAHEDGSSESQPVAEDKPARDDASNNADDQIIETTISVDEEGNELARQEGTLNARNGDVEFNGKTYTHFSTEVDEATKTTKHIYN